MKAEQVSRVHIKELNQHEAADGGGGSSAEDPTEKMNANKTKQSDGKHRIRRI